MVLASNDATDLQKLADMADKLIEVATPFVSAVSIPAPPINDDVKSFREEVERITTLVASNHINSNSNSNAHNTDSSLHSHNSTIYPLHTLITSRTTLSGRRVHFSR